MGSIKVVKKKAKLEVRQDERWASDSEELQLVSKALAQLGFRGKSLSDITNQTYTTVRVGNFSAKTLKGILVSNLNKLGVAFASDQVTGVVDQIQDWSTEVADYRLAD